MESAVEAPIAPANLFEYRHTAKKRRFIRKRDADTEENETASEGLQPSATSDAPGTNGEASSGEARNGDAMEVDGEEEKGLSLAEILRRRRKPNRPKGLDVVTPVPRISREPDSEAPPSEDEAVKETDQELQAVVNRFTHQTGQILDVDKHMVAYIETEMERRRRERGDPPSQSAQPTTSSENGSMKSAFWQPIRPEGRGATLGKLHEVDLGEENKLRNINRTQEATRRLEDGQPLDDMQDDRRGKKGYRKRRRNSQDIQRDKLVEEVLKESKLEIYDEPEEQNDEEEEGAMDDRIAEKFRREFLDALMSRRRRRGNYQKNKKKDETKRPRGPKLGGSRSARAAMRESQMAQQNGSKK